MNEEEDEVVLLDRPVVYLEPDELVEDFIGPEDATAEYVLAQVDADYDEVVVEPEEIVLGDDDAFEELDVA